MWPPRVWLQLRMRPPTCPNSSAPTTSREGVLIAIDALCWQIGVAIDSLVWIHAAWAKMAACSGIL